MSNHPNRGLSYAVRWVSPRGFANEGSYLYGRSDAINADHDVAQIRRSIETSGNGRIVTMSRHRTLDAARIAAEALVRQSKRGEAWGEQSYVDIRGV